MVKTFREIMVEIKEGETWEVVDPRYRTKAIEMISDRIIITVSDIEKGSEDVVITHKDTKFKLKRNEYTFAEAFAEYEKGEIVESVITGNKYCLNHGGSDTVNEMKTTEIEFREIRGKWYINR